MQYLQPLEQIDFQWVYHQFHVVKGDVDKLLQVKRLILPKQVQENFGTSMQTEVEMMAEEAMLEENLRVAEDIGAAVTKVSVVVVETETKKVEVENWVEVESREETQGAKVGSPRVQAVT